MSILFFSSDKDGDKLLAALQAALPGHTLSQTRPKNPAEVKYAIVWNPPQDFFEGLENLSVIFSMAAGVDHLLDHSGLPDGVPIVRLEDAGMGEKIAEYVLYGVLHAHRCMQHYRTSQQQANWDLSLTNRHAADFHVGIMGLGQMGQAAARKLVLNGYKVSGWSARAKQLPDVECLYGQSQLSHFCSDLDVLVCLLPLTQETKGILDHRLFATIKKGAYLINAARGGHLNDQALLDALGNGQLSGALLDVTQPEPLPKGHAFWHQANIILTPHIAAPTQQEQSLQQVVDNINRCETGAEPRGVINRDRGY